MACSQRGMVVSEWKIFKNGHLSSVKFQNFAVFSIFHHFPPLLVKILNTQPTHLIITLSPPFLIKITPLSSLSIKLIKEELLLKFFPIFHPNLDFLALKILCYKVKNYFSTNNFSNKNKFLGKNILPIQKAYNTRDSQDVSDPSTNRAQRCLTCQIGRDGVFSTWYSLFQKEIL